MKSKSKTYLYFFSIFSFAPFMFGPAQSAPTLSAKPIKCAQDAGWNDPASARRLYGNTWYVGTCGVSSVLITTQQGHILIDGGTPEAANLIETNIRSLGFQLSDVRYILSSHEHFDHVGGIAQLQRNTGAKVLARAAAIPALERGANDRSDPQYKIIEGFSPVKDIQPIADGETLKLGATTLTAHATPGHTQGSTSWTWRSCVANQCKQIAYVDSLSAISDDEYQYSDESQHPGVLQSFRATLHKVAKLPCDILITPHPSASDLWPRLDQEANKKLVNKQACQQYAQKARVNLDARIAKEKSSTP
jgi:metallo-beta-lactamase class B